MTQAEEALRLAARVAGAADVLDVRMLNSSTDLEKLIPEGDLAFSLDLETKVEREDDSPFFVVRLKMSVRISEAMATEPEESPDNVDDENVVPNAVAVVECEHAALYEMVDLGGYEPSEGEFQAYAETSGTLTLFPYGREYITDSVNRLGLPRLVLPPHRLPSPWHADDSDGAE